ncbi:hypothetical protein GGQ74_000173 [Desulfobaculum xiamenense]|uniref:DUF3047 domain-containing protein n=1 Tax=Desulfobaculum xiamenense TaxID=995050 RepID=A0A846QK30_9BACT|nr:DUF3047 domain-containing protein [Desulfobaculum xiamenense]NJB66533.1 hypothetical protein [Desulfobaculum xiamenense]
MYTSPMKKHAKGVLAALALTAALPFFGPPQACAETFLREDFATLDNWKEQTFKKIPRHTTYTAGKVNGVDALMADSRSSASGLVLQKVFDVYEHPLLRWRWKVGNIIPEADGTKKTGDDYPLRIYVVFTYDPGSATGFTKLRYSLAKMVNGDYPPHSTLNYVWANVENTPDHFRSPYTDRAAIIPLRRGPADAGIWLEESVNIVDDYRRVFGEDPPHKAALAIMTDTDNTRSRATAFIDWIEVD